MSSERADKCLDAGSNAFRTVDRRTTALGELAIPLLKSMPFLTAIDPSRGVLARLKLADGVGPKDIFFGDLAYARRSRKSNLFNRLSLPVRRLSSVVARASDMRTVA